MKKIFRFTGLVLGCAIILYIIGIISVYIAFDNCGLDVEIVTVTDKIKCFVLSIGPVIFGFPMIHFWSQLGGDWLSKYWGDDAVMYFFYAIDAILWSIVIVSAGCVVQRLRKKQANTKQRG